MPGPCNEDLVVEASSGLGSVASGLDRPVCISDIVYIRWHAAGWLSLVGGNCLVKSVNGAHNEKLW
jgi:hypothetical protein